MYLNICPYSKSSRIGEAIGCRLFQGAYTQGLMGVILEKKVLAKKTGAVMYQGWYKSGSINFSGLSNEYYHIPVGLVFSRKRVLA